MKKLIFFLLLVSCNQAEPKEPENKTQTIPLSVFTMDIYHTAMKEAVENEISVYLYLAKAANNRYAKNFNYFDTGEFSSLNEAVKSYTKVLKQKNLSQVGLSDLETFSDKDLGINNWSLTLDSLTKIINPKFIQNIQR